MSLSVIQRTPLIKRVPTRIDRTEGIQRYDVDNLYPQRFEEVRNRSYTVKASTQKLSQFLTGRGFENTTLNATIVNHKGETVIDILSDICDQASLYTRSFALHIGYNLNGQISSINRIKFKYNRLGIPNNDVVTSIFYSTNWEDDPSKEVENRKTVLEYPTYNPNPEIVKQQIAEFGGILKYPGQIWYYTPSKNQYPESTFDPVVDQAQTQGEIGVYSLSNIQEGFVGTTIFKYPGKFADEDEEQEVNKKMNAHKGGGGKRIIVAENAGGKAENLFETISPVNIDKQFEFTSRETKNAIMENYGMPKEILGVLPETGMFNKENMEQAYLYYNTVTQVGRDEIANKLSGLLSNWRTPLPESTIVPLMYGGV